MVVLVVGVGGVCIWEAVVAVVSCISVWACIVVEEACIGAWACIAAWVVGVACRAAS